MCTIQPRSNDDEDGLRCVLRGLLRNPMFLRYGERVKVQFPPIDVSNNDSPNDSRTFSFNDRDSLPLGYLPNDSKYLLAK